MDRESEIGMTDREVRTLTDEEGNLTNRESESET